jgi:C4-dicarboxylate-specific signal transduction histidine kinase
MKNGVYQFNFYISCLAILIWSAGYFYLVSASLIVDQGASIYFVIINALLFCSLIIINIFNLKYIQKLKNENLISKNEMEKFSVFCVQANRLNSLVELCAGLAHEINNPLSMLHFRFQKIRRILTNENLEKESLLSEVNKLNEITERISTVVNSLRDFSNDGQNELIEEVNLYSRIQGALVLISEKIKQDNISLSISGIPKDLTLECKPSALVQVLMNLISNSADAIRGTQKAWINIEAYEQHETIVISVADSGVGIEEKNIQKIFEPFYTTKPPGKGMGLGLSVAYGIVADHGGKIFYDKNHLNTRFVIELPKGGLSKGGLSKVHSSLKFKLPNSKVS